MGIFDKFRKPKKAEEVRKEEKKKIKAVAKDLPHLKQEVKAKKDEKKPERGAKAVEKPEKRVKEIKYKNAYRVLIKPVVSEKATYLTSQNSYVFEVAPDMNKIEIKKAILSVYGVEPIKVNIINVPGKFVRYGRVRGRTKNWKKAIVTLKPGETIQIYEGV